MATPTIYKTTSSSPSIDQPKGIAIDSDMHRLLIADSGNNRLVHCYIGGIKQITTKGSYDAGSFSAPSGVLYHKGYFYIGDTGNHTVVRLRARDLSYKDHFGTYGTSGSTNTKLNSPTDLTTDGEYLYVCDTGNSRIMKLVLSSLTYSAKTSSINGSLTSPLGIDYKRANGEALFISDNGGARIIKCQTDFTYIEQNNSDITVPNQVLHYKDYVYVCDQTLSTDYITILSSDGLTSVTTLSDSTVVVDVPYGMAVYRDALFITDYNNDRVTVWKVYNPRDSFTQATPMKFGGVFFDNPLIVVDDDQLIVGDTQESGSVNRWKEENINVYSVGFLEETATTSTHGDWTEES